MLYFLSVEETKQSEETWCKTYFTGRWLHNSWCYKRHLANLVLGGLRGLLAIYHVAVFYLALNIWDSQTLMRQAWSRIFNYNEIIYTNCNRDRKQNFSNILMMLWKIFQACYLVIIQLENTWMLLYILNIVIECHLHIHRYK